MYNGQLEKLFGLIMANILYEPFGELPFSIALKWA